MKLTIDLSPAQAERLRHEADRSRSRLRRESFETGRAEELLDAGPAAEPEPDGAGGRLEAQLETQEWAATALEEEPVEGVLDELRVRVETRRISVRGLKNLSEPSRHTGRHGRSPSPLVRAQRARSQARTG